MHLYWACLLATTFVVSLNGAILELFSDLDYYGDIPLPGNGASCVNLNSLNQKKLSSVRAEGTCVIFYDGSGCTGKSFKIDREDVPKIFLLEGQGTHENFDDRAVSFKLCDQAEGGNEVTLEIYNQTNYADEPLLRYENMCTCATISEEFVNLSSINNHHHCVRLFTTDDCNTEEDYETIFPGKSDVTADLSKTQIFGKVRSLRPCDVPKQCFQMQAALTEIQIEDNNNLALFAASSSGFMNMNAKTVFYNNGSATVSQEYSATKVVRQVIEVQKMTYNSRIEQWSRFKSDYIGADIGVGFQVRPVTINLGAHLGKAVKDSYAEINEESRLNDETLISETTVEFSVRQRIEVPPCQSYSVDSMIRIVENYPLQYKSFFKLEGKNGNKRMTAEDLIAEVMSMEEYTYNHTVDEFAVVAYSTNQILTTFGAETEIIGEGGRVPGCFMK